MADKKISELNSLTGANAADGDLVAIVDVSATETKKITRSEFFTDTPSIDVGGTVTATGFVTTGDMTFGDNDKAIFGAGSDLQIYHDGSGSYIRENGTGDLLIQASNIQLEDPDGNNYIRGVDGGILQLYYSGAEVMRTAATGIDVTGTVTADGLTVEGDSFLKGSGTNTTPLKVFSDNSTTNNTTTIELGDFTGGGAFEIARASITAQRYGAGSGGVLTFTTGENSGATLTNRMTIDALGDISFFEDTGTTAKFFWDASAESLGIGTSSPQRVLVLSKSDSTGVQSQFTNSTTGTSASAGFTVGIDGSENAELWNFENTNMIFATNASEAARIDASGNLLINGTTTVGYKFHVYGDSAFERTGTTSQTMVVFRNGNGTVGTISTSGSSTAYNTSSDYRLKTDAQPMVGASDRVLALKPCNFAWKADGTRVDGFLAHEAQAVVPEAVTGEKDGEEMQAIDHSKLVPLLTAALQEALTEINNLKARVATLEG